MPAGDVFGLDGFFLNKSNPITVSSVEINSTASGAGITVTSGVFSTSGAVGIATLTFSTAAGLTTTPFYTGAKIAVSGLSTAGVAYTGYNGVFVVTGFAGTTTVSYATTGYVGSVTAGITTTGLVMLVTDTAVTNTTWSSAQTHGWFGGGYTGSTLSRVDRIDFSNDTGTANIRGPLSSARRSMGVTGNSNYGWFAGGLFSLPIRYSTVERIDFSNDLSATSPRGPLSSTRYRLAATGNSNYGWFGGGNPGGAFSTIDRIDFSNDSGTASVRGPLSSTRYSLTATGNSDFGWFGGGASASIVNRVEFSNDSPTTTIRGSLSQARRQLAATGNSNYGWFGGGYFFPPTTRYSTVDRIDFSNDLVTASVRGPLSASKYALAATGNSNYGWFAAGKDPAYYSTVDRIDFSNDSSTTSVRGPLSAAKGYSGATSGQARSRSTNIPKTGTYGWFAGGFVNISYVDRIDFTNDTGVSARGNLPLGRGYTAGAGNINYGWFAGSYPAVSSIDRIDYSNDGIQASVRGPLTGGSYRHSSAGNSSYGWFAGGSPGAASSAHQRIDYSNDLLTARRKSAPNSVNGLGVGAAGNTNYSWWGTGNGGGTIYSRLDYSNDLDGFLNRGFSNYSNRYNMAQSAVSNQNYGWWGGGQLPSPTYITSVERINFANDFVKTLLRASLNSSNPAVYGRANAAAAGNSDYGWFTGGEAPFAGDFSLVDRITYVNDTATISPRTLLAQGSRTGHGGTANTNIG
jgi:hypothetical protein